MEQQECAELQICTIQGHPLNGRALFIMVIRTVNAAAVEQLASPPARQAIPIQSWHEMPAQSRTKGEAPSWCTADSHFSSLEALASAH